MRLQALPTFEMRHCLVERSESYLCFERHETYFGQPIATSHVYRWMWVHLAVPNLFPVIRYIHNRTPSTPTPRRPLTSFLSYTLAITRLRHRILEDLYGYESAKWSRRFHPSRQEEKQEEAHGREPMGSAGSVSLSTRASLETVRLDDSSCLIARLCLSRL